MTLDVDSLYTNINNKEGLAAVAEAFAKTKHKDLNFSLRPDKEIMDLLKLSLENNYSLFTQLKETLPAAFGHKFITPYERNFLCSSLIRN